MHTADSSRDEAALRNDKGLGWESHRWLAIHLHNFVIPNPAFWLRNLLLIPLTPTIRESAHQHSRFLAR
jgi:hypothetical protein